MLMHYIGILPVSAVEGQDNMSYHFYGFAIYLLIWTYEVIPSLGKERALLARPTERPLCLRWQFPKRTKGYFDFFDKLVDVLETLSLSGVDQEHLRLLHIDDDLSKGIQYVAPQRLIPQGSSGATLGKRSTTYY